MNRIYAATVPVGWEMKVKKLIDHFCNHMVQVLRGDEWRKNDMQMQSVSGGYVYLRIPSDKNDQIRADLYHQIKTLPCVYRLIQKPIPEDEVQSYFNNIPSEVVEITVPQAEEEAFQNKQEQLHQANTEGNIAQKKILINDIKEQSSSSVEAFEETRKEAKQKGVHHMMAVCYAVVRQNKVKFTFPRFIVKKAYQNMKKQGIHAVDAFNLVPVVIGVMRDELQLE